MKALDKIKVLKEKKEREGYQGPYFLDIDLEENDWQPDEVESYAKEYPWLPEFYLNFIRNYDTLGLAWVVFFGSEKLGRASLKDKINSYKDQMREEYFPFAKDADGSIYAFNKKGEVIYFDIDDYNWKKPIFIAKDLEAFIGECLLGKRFGEFNNIETSKFYPFLKSQGWA